jgi:hypothetical protein
LQTFNIKNMPYFCKYLIVPFLTSLLLSACSTTQAGANEIRPESPPTELMTPAIDLPHVAILFTIVSVPPGEDVVEINPEKYAYTHKNYPYASESLRLVKLQQWVAQQNVAHPETQAPPLNLLTPPKPAPSILDRENPSHRAEVYLNDNELAQRFAQLQTWVSSQSPTRISR